MLPTDLIFITKRIFFEGVTFIANRKTQFLIEDFVMTKLPLFQLRGSSTLMEIKINIKLVHVFCICIDVGSYLGSYNFSHFLKKRSRFRCCCCCCCSYMKHCTSSTLLLLLLLLILLLIYSGSCCLIVVTTVHSPNISSSVCIVST